MAAQHDHLVNWLLSDFALQTSVVHVGQYCGPWQASTAGHETGSFHLVLKGTCWLHRPGQAPLALHAGDSVFLLRDLPHSLRPVAHDDGPTAACVPMRPLAEPMADGTGLACGFFGYRGATAAWLLGALPELIVLRADDAGAAPVAQLFGLVQAEALQMADPEAPSPVMARLVETLFFYVLREVARGSALAQAADLWHLARDARLSPLLIGMLRAPEADWSLDRMAQLAHLSRAAFCRRFAEVSGQSPAQFVQRLRMHVAAQRLQAGASVELAAAEVGYSLQAAFSRAFQRVLGTMPGQWRRRMRPWMLPTPQAA